MKVLNIGHLPMHVGGKQSSGLAQAIWSITNHVNQLELGRPIEATILATDLHNTQPVKIENTTVFGWNKKLLLSIILKRPHWFISHFLKARKLATAYKVSFSNTLAKLLVVKHWVSQIQPDVIHLHGPLNYMLYAHMSGADLRRCVVTLHGVCGEDKNINNFEALYQIEEEVTRSEVPVKTFVSKLILDEWHDTYGNINKEEKVIINSFDRNHFFLPADNPIKKESPALKLLTIGTFQDRKGQLRVIDTLRQLAEDQQKDIIYSCIGKIQDEELISLNQSIENEAFEFRHLRVLTPAEIRNELLKTDFMILPSSSEGFGLVLLESLACGTPVVVPKDLPIVHEGFLNEQNSVLIESASSDSILSFLRRAKEHRFDRQAVTQTVANSSWMSIASEYANIYQKVSLEV